MSETNFNGIVQHSIESDPSVTKLHMEFQQSHTKYLQLTVATFTDNWSKLFSTAFHNSEKKLDKKINKGPFHFEYVMH